MPGAEVSLPSQGLGAFGVCWVEILICFALASFFLYWIWGYLGFFFWIWDYLEFFSVCIRDAET